MNPADPIAHRVARRHRAAVVLLRCPQEPSYRVDFTDSGRISGVALARVLEPIIGSS